MSTDSFNTAKTESTTNTWITPRSVLDPLGHFDMDPCAADTMPWQTADVMITKAQNGLTTPWRGRIWCNPPYGNECAAFLSKMSTHREGGLALIFVRTDTRAWHEFILHSAKYIFFYKGRLKFCKEDGTAGGTANAPSCLVAWCESERPVLEALEAAGKGKLVKL